MFELLGELSPEMVDRAAEKPGRKRNILKLVTSLAAAACLAAAIFALLPRGSHAPVPNGGTGGGGDNAPGWIDGVVVETGEHIVVEAAEWMPWEAKRFVLTMTEYSPAPGNMPEDLRVGEGVRVMCNINSFIPVDSDTVEVPVVFAIYRHVGNVDLLAGLDKSELAREINELYGAELTRPVTSEDIDLRRAVKIYVDTNIFALRSADRGTVLEALEHGRHVYLLPVEAGERTVVANIQLGLPLNSDAGLSEAEREEVLAREGHYFASSFALYTTGREPDYGEIIRKYAGEPRPDAVLVGGLPFFRDPVALVTFDGVDAVIPLTGSFDAAAIRDLELAPGVYDYGKVRDYVNSLPPQDPDLCG